MPENLPSLPAPLLRVVEGKTFENEPVVLDGYTYSRCVFLRCRIVYSGHPFHLHECKFLNGCLFEFRDAANSTLGLIQQLCNSQPEFRLQMFPDWQSWNRDNPGSRTVH